MNCITTTHYLEASGLKALKSLQEINYVGVRYKKMKTGQLTDS